MSSWSPIVYLSIALQSRLLKGPISRPERLKLETRDKVKVLQIGGRQNFVMLQRRRRDKDIIHLGAAGKHETLHEPTRRSANRFGKREYLGVLGIDVLLQPLKLTLIAATIEKLQARNRRHLPLR
jgi:hypothetical protein